MTDTYEATVDAAADDSYEVTDREAMVATMRRYKKLTDEIASDRENGRIVLRQVEAEIEQDMRSKEESALRMKEAMERFITHTNEGERFRVPGLGVAYTQTRRKTTIEDYDDAAKRLEARDRRNPVSLYRYVTEVDKKLVRERVEAMIRDEGELIEGVKSEEVTSVSVRWS